MGAAATWKLAPVSGEDIANLSPDDFRDRQFPARQFARDVRAIVVSAKDAMTCRQWTSLLEAVLRLAAVSHVAWLCDVNSLIWSSVSGALQGAGPDTPEEARAAIFPSSMRYMAYGGKALLAIKDKASSYPKSLAFLARANARASVLLQALEGRSTLATIWDSPGVLAHQVSQ